MTSPEDRRSVRIPLLGGLILTLLVSGNAPGVRASRVGDLDLAVRQKHWTRFTREIDNPHDLPCTECHRQDPLPDGRISYSLPPDTIDLCKTCHSDPAIHPVGVSPKVLRNPPESLWLPLGTGKDEGSIVCLTCHYMHNKRYFSKLLRGDDTSGRHRRDYLCAACHGADLTDRSPHRGTGRSCTFCHTKRPRVGDPLSEILRADVQNRCNFCHDTLDEGHYLTVNPFSDPELSEKDMDIPLFMGRFTCISCHDPHAREAFRAKMLRPDYLKLAAVSRRINPHWKDVMCISCHEEEPSEGSPSLKHDGDIDRICSRCHDGVIARNDVHPTGKEPSDTVTVPHAMPLREGRLTCGTCHDSSLQEGGEKLTSVRRVNPSFLRDGFTTRNEFCFRCHHQDRYRRMNAHQQMSPSGSLQVRSCLFCHSSLPDVEVAGVETVAFDTESLEDYCTVCHTGTRFIREHPAGEHLVEPPRDYYRAIETAEERIGVRLPLHNDRITCATCHNPHQEGVIQDEAAAMGAGEKGRLRLQAGRWQCVGCHLEKGGYQ